jgi:hypothetical protein
MAKRFALYFGAAGYLLVLWYNGFAFAPLRWAGVTNALYHACPMCADKIGAPWWNLLLVRPGVNALSYAAVGLVAGGILQKLRRT